MIVTSLNEIGLKGIDMNYNHLKYFVVSVECMSISKAARQLNVSQPNLSRALGQLEKEIGEPLLNRSNKGISLTKEGVNFYSLARDIVSKSEALEEAYVKKTAPPAVTLNVAAFPERIALEAMKVLMEKMDHEEYIIRVFNYSMKEVIRSVCMMQCELGVVFLTPQEDDMYRTLFRDQKLEYHRLGRAYPCANIGKSNPLYDRKEVTLKELEAYPMVR